MDPIGMLVAALGAVAALSVVFALQAALRRRRLLKRREPAQWVAFELGASQGRGPIAGPDAVDSDSAVELDGIFRGDPEAAKETPYAGSPDRRPPR